MTSLAQASRTRQLLSLGLGTTLTLVLLSWAFRDVNWPQVWTLIGQAQWGWLLVGWVSYMLCYGMRALRWGRLLRTVLPQPGRWRDRLAALVISFGVSSTLPAYLGEIARVMVLHRQAQVPRSTAIGSIFAERLLDVGVVFALWMLPLGLGALPNATLNNLPWQPVALAVLAAWLLLLLGACFPQGLSQGFGQLLTTLGMGRWRGPLQQGLHDFLMGLKVLRHPGQTLMALGDTFVVWGLTGITYWAVLMAFGLQSPGFVGAIFTQSTVALAIAIPATPGYVGPFEAAIRFALGLYGLPQSAVLAYAIVMRVLMYVTIPIIAWAIAARMGFSSQELRHAARHAA
jgi:glycosyltransferase 2 family protein